MIVAAVVCPHPPLLLRELSGAQDAVPDLRAACHEALGRALRLEVTTVVVVGGADTAGAWSASLPDAVRRFGTTGAATGPALPLSLTVGRRLVRSAGWDGPLLLRSVGWDADDSEVADVAEDVAGLGDASPHVLLVVMGDGGARRGEKAPGYLDDRSFGFDATVEEALRSGDAAVLRDLDPDLAGQLMALGRPAFAVLGATVDAAGLRATGEVLHSADPYGVQYTVALWELR